MARLLKVSEVFVPGRLPATTYNPRVALELELDLQDYLDETGSILTVAGPTKTGKTVLLRRVITDPVWVDGQGIENVDQLWGLVADQLSAYTGIEFGTEESATGGGIVGSEAGFGPIVKVKAEARYEASDSNTARYSVERPLSAVAKGALKVSMRALVIDDFHFVGPVIQKQIVRALKPLVLAGVPIVFVSISHRVQDVVTAEPDMTGRVTALHVPFWESEELAYIADKGFAALNVVDDEGELARRLATESYGSPHLMQKFCRELCKVNGVRNRSGEPVALQAPGDWSAFFRDQADAASRDWFERLLAGPQERGTKRTQWKIVGDGTLDGYGLTLRAISSTGPKPTLTKDEIRDAVDAEVDGAGPAAHQTTRVLQHLSRIAGTRMTERAPTEEELDEASARGDLLPDVQPVLEYMEDEKYSRLHIADPFFAFFLRWGSSAYLDGDGGSQGSGAGPELPPADAQSAS